ncbi:hypothetical protein AAVH_26273, partial [Aphelenchoides avenae]
CVPLPFTESENAVPNRASFSLNFLLVLMPLRYYATAACSRTAPASTSSSDSR